MKAKQAKHPQSRLRTVTLGQLLEHRFPVRAPILKGLLYRQDLGMIYGVRGSGKTHVAAELAYAVASGHDFGPWQVPKARHVFFLDGEMAGVALKKRLETINSSVRSRKALRRLHVVTPDLQTRSLPYLDTSSGQKAIDAQMPAETRLIVVDNLSCWTRSAADDPAAWERVARWARRQRRENRAVLFIHHANKLGRQRGTSRKEDLLDVVVRIAPPMNHEIEQGTKIELRFEKARHLVGKRLRARLAELETFPNGRREWTWSELEDAASVARRIRKLRARGASLSQIGKRLGKDKSTISRILSRLPA